MDAAQRLTDSVSGFMPDTHDVGREQLPVSFYHSAAMEKHMWGSAALMPSWQALRPKPLP
jgi:hypothetical protein